MDKETRDKVRELLEKATIIMVEDIEEPGGIVRFGRDSKAREGFISYLAARAHENLAKEIKYQVNSFLFSITERINKL